MSNRFRQFGLWVYDEEEDKYLSIELVVNILNKQQDELERLQKIIDLTAYQLKVQDRILDELGE